MDRIPILRMGDFLLVTIQVDMHDQLALSLQDDLTNLISLSGANKTVTFGPGSPADRLRQERFEQGLQRVFRYQSRHLLHDVAVAVDDDRRG